MFFADLYKLHKIRYLKEYFLLHRIAGVKYLKVKVEEKDFKLKVFM